MNPRLPAGLTTRPVRDDEAGVVFRLFAATERHETGRADVEEADIVSDWARPSFDLAASSMGVFEGADLVGYAEITGADRYDAAVHPAAYGRGIGTWLAAWARDTVRARGAAVLGMPVPDGSTGDRLLTALGYHVRWTSWVLKLPAGATIADRQVPEGYAVRQAAEAEYPQVHEVVEDAFLEWSVREREPYADFLAGIVGRPGFAPWQLRVVTDAQGAVVGAAQLILTEDEVTGAGETYINRLAVRADQRHRGLAQALLVDSFAVGREHGGVTSCLSTDSRTGALDLYLKVGMAPTAVWVNRAVDLA